MPLVTRKLIKKNKKKGRSYDGEQDNLCDVRPENGSPRRPSTLQCERYSGNTRSFILTSVRETLLLFTTKQNPFIPIG